MSASLSNAIAPRSSAHVQAIARARLLERVSGIGEPQGVRRRHRRGRQGRVRCVARQALRARPARHRSARSAARRSPYGFPLGITYPKADPDALFAAVAEAQASWRTAGARGVGRRVPRNPRAHQPAELPDGQCRHAHDRPGVHDGVPGSRPACAGPRRSKRSPTRGTSCGAFRAQRTWEKPQGKGDPIRMEKRFRVVPRGVGLVIGCCTFPTWNGYPGLFADLATGNAVVVKPHPGAILPLAITVRIAREVLAEAGFDPNVVTLVAHEAGDDTAQELALRPDVKLIDFTGSSANGNWLESNARQAQVYTEKAGRQPDRHRFRRRLRRAVRATSRSRSRSTPARCARRRRTSTCRRMASTRPMAISASTRWRAALADGGGEAARPIRHAPSRFSAPCRTTACAQRIDEARALGPHRARHAADHAPAVSRTPPFSTPLIVKLAAPTIATSSARNGSARSPSSSRPKSTEREPRHCARCGRSTKGALTLSVYTTSEEVIAKRDRRCRRMRRRAVDQPDRRRVRQSVGGVLRLPRHGRQSGRQCRADRRGIRREPFSRRAASRARVSLSSATRDQCR